MIELPKKFSKIEQEVSQLIDNEEYDKALEIVKEIENEQDGEKYVLLADIFHFKNDIKNCEKYLLLAIKSGQNNSLHNLGLVYFLQEKNKLAEKYYLKAHKYGDSSSLINLGVLYEDINEIEKSEKCYLEAIEKNIDFAFNNLAILYLNHNYKPQDSLKNIRIFNKLKTYSKSNYLEILIEVWNGIFNLVEDKIIKLIKNKPQNETLEIDFFLNSLLIHQQKNLVLKLFQNQEIGKELQDKYSILYYVTLLLNNSKEENLELKIPPEIKETVNNILEQIKERQVFYGY